MSLVDYASSSDDENDAAPEKEKNPSLPQPENPNNIKDPNPYPPPNPTPTPSSVENKLPDAALLLSGAGLSSSSSSSSSLLGKRDPVRAGPALPRSKVPRGAHLPLPKNVPETGGGLLVPPQLRGRSNVVTEDIGKLFVRRNTESPPS